MSKTPKRPPVKPLIAPEVNEPQPTEETRPTRFFIALYSYPVRSFVMSGEYYVTAFTYPSLREVKNLLSEHLNNGYGVRIAPADIILYPLTEVSEEDFNNAKQ